MKSQTQPKKSPVYQFIVVCTSFAWLLAVYKVFILDDGLEYNTKITVAKHEEPHHPIKSERMFTHDSKLKSIHKTFKKSSNGNNVYSNVRPTDLKAPSSA